MSPELFQNMPYNYKSDVWALGCVLYELCNLRRPFDAQFEPGLIMKVLAGSYMPMNGIYSKELRELVTRMLSLKSEERPSIGEILTIPFVKKRAMEYLEECLKAPEIDKAYIESLKEQTEQISALEPPKQNIEVSGKTGVPVPLRKRKRFLVVEGKGQLVKKSDESKRISEIRSKLTKKQKMEKKLKSLRKESRKQALDIREKLLAKRKNSDIRNLSELSKCLLISEIQGSAQERCPQRNNYNAHKSEIDRKPFCHLNNAEFNQVFRKRRSHANSSMEAKDRRNSLSYKKIESKCQEESKSNSRRESEVVSGSNCDKKKLEVIQKAVAKYGEEFKEELSSLEKTAMEIENVKQIMQQLEVPNDNNKTSTIGFDHPTTLPLISDADENSEKEVTPEKEKQLELKLDESRRDLADHIKALQR
eukprot:TRINITY_DN1966_c0_g2_i12.p1 TRINITY_DN1966_c0_g2~~TRINITY_DN1966_c0_g2_i12.p1  ORF type:complete len:420 (-),score=132.33 TRINITY_DN1966_c0_g2_i12:341-1600(-)